VRLTARGERWLIAGACVVGFALGFLSGPWVLVPA
jgi:hypothetical protein